MLWLDHEHPAVFPKGNLVETNGGGLAASAIPKTSAAIIVSNLTAAGNNAAGLGGAIYGAVGLGVSVVVGENLARESLA
jgi:hypothetical protein